MDKNRVVSSRKYFLNTSVNKACNWRHRSILGDNIAAPFVSSSFFWIATCSLIIICCFMTMCKRGRKHENRKKTAPPVLYYLAKTSYKDDHSNLCMKLIEKENYNVNDVSAETQLSVFLCACLSGNSELVSFMIEQGANIHSVSCHGDSALYLATYGYLNSTKPDLRVIGILIASGCDVNHQNSSGFTCLHLASSKGDVTVAQYLMLKGADPNISNCDGILPLQLALNAGSEIVAENLIKRMGVKKKCSSVHNF